MVVLISTCITSRWVTIVVVVVVGSRRRRPRPIGTGGVGHSTSSVEKGVVVRHDVGYLVLF
jgi:hypothetical protein